MTNESPDPPENYWVHGNSDMSFIELQMYIYKMAKINALPEDILDGKSKSHCQNSQHLLKTHVPFNTQTSAGKK